ncbi:deoxynucleoside kinase-like isoform X2 [Tigriopus californicus]|uniref:deoxynucleoside kinase-like isoform X2 n=1 Tax=Tigriopus californicus TaxID=6832 RepID=UPI0027D9F2AC|nr:deoxynucleoside kinase-like isoform X2 [Tigriopus californicus]
MNPVCYSSMAGHWTRGLSRHFGNQVKAITQAFHGMDPPTIQSRLIMTSAPRRPFTIVVEGNIGSGKSTFLNEFQDLSNELEIMPEPVDKWRNCHGTNLLQRMYEDPKRWSMLFQTYVQLTMMQQHTKPCAKPTRIMERSFARYCFVENLYAEGKLEDCEYAVLSEWFNYLLTCPSMNFKIDLIIYLRTRPDVAFQRIKDRDRSEECRIPFQYIQDLHDLHEDWLIRKTKFQPLQAPVIVIEANEDLDKLQAQYQRQKDEILQKSRTN